MGSFNLETAIATWRQFHAYRRVFLNDDLDELERHLRDFVTHQQAQGHDDEAAFRLAVDNMGDFEGGRAEYEKVYWGKHRRQHTLTHELYWRLSMFKNYLKIAVRNFIKQKGYSLINVAGLALGGVCCLFIYLFVQNELRTDTFHAQGDRIYRVVRVVEDDDGLNRVGITSAPFRDALADHFPDMIEQATRLMPSDGVVTIGDDQFLEQRLSIADANFFQVFSYPLLAGDPETVLARPNTMVLSEATAQKYFGTRNPVGQTLLVDGDMTFEVTGVFRQPPHTRSHVAFDLLISMETVREARFYSEWWWNTLFTYVMLSPEVNPTSLQAQLPRFMDQYFGEDMARNNRRIDLMLQPLEAIYFDGDTDDWRVIHGSKAVIYLFMVIALLIIGVACINFVNMTTARSVGRAREIGIRKTLGAWRLHLMSWFLGEALLLTATAGVLAFGTVYLLRPWFEQVIGTRLVVDLFSVEVVGFAVVFLLLTGLLAGAYPALFLSSFEPVKALKEKISFGSSQVVVRRGLIVFQFTISSLLIIGTLIVNRQLDYVADKQLGFQPAQLMNIAINNGDIRPHLKTFQETIEQLPGVQVSSVMSGTPGGFFDTFLFRAGEQWEKTYTLRTLYTDAAFGEVMDVQMLAGRDFDPDFPTDSARAVIINKTTADLFGWTPQEALGQRFENQFRDSTAKEVIGVVADFHFESLHQPIAPLVVAMNADYREILVKVETAHLDETMAAIEQAWGTFSPLYPLEAFFLDQQFAQLYDSDRRQRRVFTAFSIIGIFIACLGLFGLAAFNAEKRRKEMGVRKVLGASVADILVLFNREVLLVVGVSFLIALPVAYLLADWWLQSYAYRVPNGGWNYVVAGAIVLVLAVLTVSYQSVKAALADPVKSLRYE